jgi:hypothetical protein
MSIRFDQLKRMRKMNIVGVPEPLTRTPRSSRILTIFAFSISMCPLVLD